MKLAELYDQSDKNCAELFSCGFDVLSYLEMVDRLTVRLGGILQRYLKRHEVSVLPKYEEYFK